MIKCAAKSYIKFSQDFSDIVNIRIILFWITCGIQFTINTNRLEHKNLWTECDVSLKFVKQKKHVFFSNLIQVAAEQVMKLSLKEYYVAKTPCTRFENTFSVRYFLFVLCVLWFKKWILRFVNRVKGQRLTYVLMSIHAGQVQRCVSVVVLGFRVGLVVQKQQLEERWTADQRGES